jgi:hypothetical protein
MTYAHSKIKIAGQIQIAQEAKAVELWRVKEKSRRIRPELLQTKPKRAVRHLRKRILLPASFHRKKPVKLS